MLDAACLLGCDESHVVEGAGGVKLQPETHAAFARLSSAAKEAGFDLCIASGFRSFERQLAIWNTKASGIRAVLDESGKPLDLTKLNDSETVFAILRWTALPGASRHHWGTDFDIYDAAALGENEKLELTVAETERDGPFFDMYCWLEEYLPTKSDFHRPYAVDTGGIAVEPWHLSYSPLANLYEQNFDKEFLRGFIQSQDLALKSSVLSMFDEIFERFVMSSSTGQHG